MSFAMRGIAPVGYTVFALVLGVALGIVLRRPLPAMALTLAVFTFVQIAMPLWVRPHLVAPVRKSVTISRTTFDGLEVSGPAGPVRISVRTGSLGDWVLSNDTVDSTGRVAALPAWFSQCIPPPPSASSPGSVSRTPVTATSLDACFARLAAEGYRQRVIYQPADHFWPLQWAETALFLALSGLLTWFSFWWTRHRLS